MAKLTRKLITDEPDAAARLLGLEPQSDEAAERLQQLLDQFDELEKWHGGALSGFAPYLKLNRPRQSRRRAARRESGQQS